MEEFEMTTVRIGLFQHALAHPEANSEKFEEVQAKPKRADNNGSSTLSSPPLSKDSIPKAHLASGRQAVRPRDGAGLPLALRHRSKIQPRELWFPSMDPNETSNQSDSDGSARAEVEIQSSAFRMKRTSIECV